MSLGILILTVILVGFGAMGGLQFWMQSQAAAQKGKPTPTLPGPLGKAVQGDALLFFHSPSCGPCIAMHPRIDAMALADDRIHSIDITQQMNVAQAFRVMATPTVITIRGGTVLQSRIGPQSAGMLADLVAELRPVLSAGESGG